jgi:hypothetical protein
MSSVRTASIQKPNRLALSFKNLAKSFQNGEDYTKKVISEPRAREAENGIP